MRYKIYFNSRRSMGIFTCVLAALFILGMVSVFNDWSEVICGFFGLGMFIWMFAGPLVSDYIVSSSVRHAEQNARDTYAVSMEDEFRSRAFEEFKSNRVERNAYMKAIQEAMGDDKKLLPLYMKIRVDELMRNARGH